MRFKIVVQEGKVFVKCIDSFEDVFQVSKQLLKDAELIEILTPNTFDSHKEVLDAFFDVYKIVVKDYVV